MRPLTKVTRKALRGKRRSAAESARKAANPTGRQVDFGTSAKTLRPVAQTALTPGTVVLARIPYNDGDGWKTRPAVVLSCQGRDVTVVTLTTSSRVEGGVLIAPTHSNGLSRASRVRSGVTVIDRMLDIVTVCGRLNDDDLQHVLTFHQHRQHGAEHADCRLCHPVDASSSGDAAVSPGVQSDASNSPSDSPAVSGHAVDPGR